MKKSQLPIALMGLLLLLIQFGVAMAQSGSSAGQSMSTMGSKAGEQSTEYDSPELFGVNKDVQKTVAGEEIPPAGAAIKTEGGWVTKPAPAYLKLFGSDLFTRAATGFPADLSLAPPPDYTLGPGDNLIVQLWGKVEKEFNLTLNREGQVFIPKAGTVSLWGQNLDQAQETLFKHLSQIYSGFDMNVVLGKIKTMRVFVLGEVHRPGVYTVSSLASVLSVLSACGGPGAYGTYRDIKLIRGNKTIASIDLYDLLLKGKQSREVILADHDVIYVGVAGPHVSIRGKVKRPAIYELKDEVRLSQLIELAGGTEPDAFVKRILLDRIQFSDKRYVMDVDLTTPEGDVLLKDGDDVSVFSVFELRENIVWLIGMVKYPGAYEYFSGMKVSDLIDGGARLHGKSYLKRADLIRSYADGSQEVFPLDLEAVLENDESNDLTLEIGDSLRVYDANYVMRKKYVSIEGVVKKPGTYPLYDAMTLSDLIFLAGNPLKNAYLLDAEILRLDAEGNSEVIHVDLTHVLPDSASGAPPKNSRDLPLQDEDKVIIREKPYWEVQQMVDIRGEVVFPGRYLIEDGRLLLSELLERAGGFTPEAFPPGIMVIRNSSLADLERRGIKNQIAHNSTVYRDSLGNISNYAISNLNVDALARIVVDIEGILQNPGGPDDVLLQDGDQVVVPAMPSGVHVMGGVAANGTIKYLPGKRVSYYIEKAGGFTRNAVKGSVQVISANGSVVSGRRALRRRVDLGDAIYVPQEVKDKRDLWSVLTSSVAIISGVATTVYIIDRLD